MFGKHRSNETKQKISKSLNNSGYFRVSKKKDKRYKQGFVFVYRYTGEGKRKYISSIDIEVLEKKVKSKGLKWQKLED